MESPLLPTLPKVYGGELLFYVSIEYFSSVLFCCE